MNKKEQVLAFYREGFDANKIVELSGIPIRSVYRYISDYNNIEQKLTDKNISRQELTVVNYIKAVKTGYATKGDLAKQFHVRKETLFNFEKESGVLALLAKAEHIQGKSYEEIKTKLHLRERIIDSFNILQLPTIQQIKNELNQILAVYEKMAEVGDEETFQYNELKKLIDKLQ